MRLFQPHYCLRKIPVLLNFYILAFGCSWLRPSLGGCPTALALVFLSTTRAATLISRRRNVSNCATRHIERLGIDTRRPHMSQYAPACRNSRWLAVALVHEV